MIAGGHHNSVPETNFQISVSWHFAFRVNFAFSAWATKSTFKVCLRSAVGNREFIRLYAAPAWPGYRRGRLGEGEPGTTSTPSRAYFPGGIQYDRST